MLLREKIVRILCENAFIALFEFYRNCPDKASNTKAESEENAAIIAIGYGEGSNGKWPSSVNDFLYEYRRHVIGEYKTRGVDV